MVLKKFYVEFYSKTCAQGMKLNRQGIRWLMNHKKSIEAITKETKYKREELNKYEYDLKKPVV